jgi:hypothetical protein
MHPLQINLTELTDDEFHTKRNDLLRRLNQSYQMGMSDAVYQIQMMLEDYQVELQRRNDVQMEKLAAKSKNGQFKNIIDIS